VNQLIRDKTDYLVETTARDGKMDPLPNRDIGKHILSGAKEQ